MSRTRPMKLLVAGLVLGCGLMTKTAAGYIDPGTGSYMLQIAIAFLVGLAFSIKVFWKKIAAFLRKMFGRKTRGGLDAS